MVKWGDTVLMVHRPTEEATHSGKRREDALLSSWAGSTVGICRRSVNRPLSQGPPPVSMKPSEEGNGVHHQGVFRVLGYGVLPSLEAFSHVYVKSTCLGPSDPQLGIKTT